jgi:hypothetical protein
MTSFFQDILDLLFGPFHLLLIHLEKVFYYIVHSENQKFKTSSHIFEKETLASSYITQVDKPLLLLSSESNDQPTALVSFESFLDQKVQIPILLEHSQSCKPVEDDINFPIPSVSHIPCDQPAKIHPWDINRYKPLKFPSFLHDLPPKIFKYLPIFNGEDDVTTEKHMETFEHFTDCLDIQHEDVFMRMFTHSLVGEVKIWFRDLPVESITSWTDFHDVFLYKWAERKSHHQYLSEFYATRRRNDEIVMKFNKRFENLYHNIPVEICPSEVVAKVYYAKAHHLDLAFYLRERKSPTLKQMFIDVEEIENNLWACGKLPKKGMKIWIQRRDKKMI